MSKSLPQHKDWRFVAECIDAHYCYFRKAEYPLGRLRAAWEAFRIAWRMSA